ncbi:pentapeptide repeat-containing protein [Campylobacter lari]|nr:pentapeptide repeat-containing protein [Campylobacter lari]
MISFKPLIFFIDELLCQLENIITQRQNERFMVDLYMSFEYNNHRHIFKHPITICKNIYLDIIQSQNFISRELKLHKTHITYDFYAKRFMVSNFESGIILNPELLKKFNFMFINGLIKNQLSINNKAHSDNRYYDKSIHFLGCHFDEHFTIFQVNIKNDFIFEHVLFKKHVYIYSTKTNQNFTFLFKNCTINTINMQNNTFLSNIEFILNTKISNLELFGNNFNGILSVQDSVIENINLYENEFKNKCYFKYICFGDKESKESKINLSNANFQNDIYFDNSIFYSYADFHACEFNKIASFYGVTFDKTPNFSQAIFKGNLNAVNANLNFAFDDLQKKIKQEYEKFNEDKKEQYQKSLDKFANDFRDSFRVFKNVLIKDNNLLEASNFHKYELYCKEIELNSKKYKIFFKEWIDKYQLFFYRKLCDHHTDILQSFNLLILVIGIFGVLNLAIIIGFNCYLGYKPVLEHLYFSLDFYNFHIKPFIENNHLFIIFVNCVILFLYLILVGFALCEQYIRKFFITISYVITFFIMVTSPKILIPAMGIFTDKRVILDPLSVLGGIYTIVFGFVVYSFVKTIRKNSIVPS